DVSLVVRNDFGYSAPVLAATAIAIAALNFVAVALMPKVVKPRGGVWHVAFRLQMYVVLMCLLVAFSASLSIELWLILGGLKLLSLALLECTPAIAAWVWQTMRETVRPALFTRWIGSRTP